MCNGVHVKETGLLKSQIVIGNNCRVHVHVYVWRKGDESWLPYSISLGTGPCKKIGDVLGIKVLVRICTLCKVNGNINSTKKKYMGILENNLWTVVARHFSDINYLFVVDSVPHRSNLSTN